MGEPISYASGAIVGRDLTLKPCIIAKKDGCFAHGQNIHEAVSDVMGKALRRKPVEERVKEFVNAHPNPDEAIDGHELFTWHNTLTGSCRMGRESFCKEHGLNPATSKLSAREFVTLTKDAYGNHAIRLLAEAYNIKLK